MYSYKTANYVAERDEKEHKDHHQDPHHQCDNCGRRFFSRSKLTRHIRNSHGPVIHCPYSDCTYQCSQSRASMMRDHIYGMHNKYGKDPVRKTSLDNIPSSSATSTPTMTTKVTDSSSSSSESNHTITSAPSTAITAPLDLTSTLKTPPRMTPLDRPTSEWISPTFSISNIMTDLDFGELPTLEMGENAATQTDSTSSSTTDNQTQTDPTTPAQHSTPTQTDQTTQAQNSSSTETQTDLAVTLSTDQATNTDEPVYQPLDITPQQLAADPRFFFIGAPSHYMIGHTMPLLVAARRSAAHHAKNYSRRFIPEGYNTIRKEERLTLPDGTIYTLTDIWGCKEWKTQKSKTTQTASVSERMEDTRKVVCQSEPLDLRVRKEE